MTAALQNFTVLGETLSSLLIDGLGSATMRLFSLLAVLGLAIGLVISGEAPVQPGSAGARRRDETAPRGSAALHFGTLNVL